DAAALVERLSANQWRGAIIGPHGSGKSTLLETLCRTLEQAGHNVERVTLHAHQSRFRWPAGAAARHIVAIDGYDQLTAWSRWRIARRCRRRRWGLLVTSHRPTRLPELYRMQIDRGMFERIVAHLIADNEQLITSDDVGRVLTLHGHNAREALFALYDL